MKLPVTIVEAESHWDALFGAQKKAVVIGTKIHNSLFTDLRTAAEKIQEHRVARRGTLKQGAAGAVVDNKGRTKPNNRRPEKNRCAIRAAASRNRVDE